MHVPGRTFGRILLATAIIAVITALAGLSPARAQDISSGLVGHWKLDETSGTTAIDSAGSNDGTLENGPTWDIGKIGGGLSFEPTNERVTVPSPGFNFGSDDFSVSAWVYRRALTSDWDNGWVVNVWRQGNATDGDNDWSLGILGCSTCNYPRFSIESGTTDYVSASPDEIGLYEWYHLTGVREGTDLKIYVNGVLKATEPVGTAAMNNTGNDLKIASQHSNQFYTDAIIDDVRIYNRALSDEDIAELAAATYPGKLHYNTNYKTLDYYNGTAWHAVSKGNAPSTTGLVGHWGLDEESGTLADSSGYGNDGTQSGGIEYASSGIIGASAGFDNIDDVIDAGSDSSLDNVFAGGGTLSAWINIDGFGEDGNGRIFDKANGTNHRYGWIFYTRSSSGGLSFIHGNDANDDFGQWTAGTITTGTWHHVALVYDKEDYQNNDPAIYIDGVSQSVTEARAPPAANGADESAYSLLIGNADTTDKTFDGRIDDARIYNRALGAEEVANLYNHGAGNLSDPCNPLNDPAPGQLCTDGSYYIGEVEGNKIYAAADDESGSLEWGGYGNAHDADSMTDGYANTDWLANSSPDDHPAADACWDKAAHGHSDWHLPAREEMNLFWNGGAPIAGILEDGSWYWSSSEYNQFNGYRHRFNDGVFGSGNKSVSRHVRCVRRGYKSPCENPLGAPGRIIYNTTHDVMQYCAAGTWQAAGPVPGAGGAGCSNPARDKGRIVYNTTYNIPQYCDGAVWRSMGKDCPDIGDKCFDGSYYIGDSPEDGKRVYMTSDAHEDNLVWGAYGESDPSAKSKTDGRANTDGLVADGHVHPAAEYCDGLVAHGMEDWYLPAGGTTGSHTDGTEQTLFWEMIQAVGAAVGGIGDSTNFYWSSSEVTSNAARIQRFSDGTQSNRKKDSGGQIRCVRR